MVKGQRPVDVAVGLLYALGLDVVWGLLMLLPVSGLAWVLVIVWAMAVLAVIGFTIAEERYLVTGGFMLGQLLMFTLWLFGVLGTLSLLGGMQ
jgi:hypothetical protein